MASDLSEFLDVFFEECFEGLDAMESGLVALDSGEAGVDVEEINTIFRAAHSIKGGAATFDMMQVAEFTHVMETLLDEMRDGRRAVSKPAVDLLLASTDGLRSMVVALRAGEPVDEARIATLKSELDAMLAGAEGASPPVQAAACATTPAPQDAALASQNARWTIDFTPNADLFATGNDPQHLFRALGELGELDVQAHTDALPAFADMRPEECYLRWTLTLDTDAGEAEIRDVFAWVEDDCTLEITCERPQAEPSPARAAASRDEPRPATAEVPTRGPTPVSPASGAGDTPSPKTTAGGEATSIRVNIDKVDELINLVGELVITQSMLSRFSDGVEPGQLEKLRDGLTALARNTRELQETAMQIRMLPISTSFNRFPRLVRDLSGKLGKKVELKISGGATELDKTVLEKISDPLVHLVRNSMDHGIEMPDVRQSRGKPETGVLHLNAYHKGGTIVIEVMDDGAGLNTQRILEKALERGVVAPDAELTEEQVNNLIFQPGFSTADTVSDVSGRGVGMDVVRRNIHDLGGNVTVDSVSGKGSIFTIRLPLTLAILDGQLVRVGDQTYIISLVSIVESLQVSRDRINVIAGKSEIYQLRDEYIPVVRLHRSFNVTPDSTDLEKGLLVVVESDGSRVGLFVDDLLGQQQVVIKSLETNFQQVQGLSGATILGDGQVALILDVPGLVQRELTGGQRAPRLAAA